MTEFTTLLLCYTCLVFNFNNAVCLYYFVYFRLSRNWSNTSALLVLPSPHNPLNNALWLEKFWTWCLPASPSPSPTWCTSPWSAKGYPTTSKTEPLLNSILWTQENEKIPHPPIPDPRHPRLLTYEEGSPMECKYVFTTEFASNTFFLLRRCVVFTYLRIMLLNSAYL